MITMKMEIEAFSAGTLILLPMTFLPQIPRTPVPIAVAQQEPNHDLVGTTTDRIQ